MYLLQYLEKCLDLIKYNIAFYQGEAKATS